MYDNKRSSWRPLIQFFVFVALIWSWFAILAYGQVDIVATDGNPYKVWVGDSLITDRSFNELHTATEFALIIGQQHSDSTVYIRRSEEYRVSGFANPSMVQQLMIEAYNTPDSAFSGIKYKDTEVDSIIVINIE